MRMIPCELTLGNGGDVVAMVRLDDDGTLCVPREATYGSFPEGLLACRVMRHEDEAQVRRQVWTETGG